MFTIISSGRTANVGLHAIVDVLTGGGQKGAVEWEWERVTIVMITFGSCSQIGESMAVTCSIPLTDDISDPLYSTRIITLSI